MPLPVMRYVSRTMTDYMVEGLVKRRAALAGEMKALQARLSKLADDLTTLDGALRIVAPDLDIPSIAPKMVKPPADWSRRGEMSRVVLGMLRLSQKPLTAREIAAEMIVHRGLAATPQLMNLMTRRVAGCLRDRRDAGLVENAPTRGGQWLEWRICKRDSMLID